MQSRKGKVCKESIDEDLKVLNDLFLKIILLQVQQLETARKRIKITVVR